MPVPPLLRLGSVAPALLLTAVLTAGCASSAPPGPPPVPVFFEADAVPCAYEVVGTLQEEVVPERDRERQMREVLGRAGGRRGADAVLSEASGVFTVERIDFNDRREQGIQRVTLRGDLLRYTDPTCGGAPAFSRRPRLRASRKGRRP